ncbi:hypothetical protein SAMD00079811_02170 [Scytonema sp. HK-05]|nr:hypothetical protein SAMD00079811_02170 [Scytonema sp. HK-05]
MVEAKKLNFIYRGSLFVAIHSEPHPLTPSPQGREGEYFPLLACGESSAAGGFPAVGDWRSRSVSVRPQAVPEGLRRYPEGEGSGVGSKRLHPNENCCDIIFEAENLNFTALKPIECEDLPNFHEQ